MSETGQIFMGSISHKSRRRADERPRDRLGQFLRDRFKGYGAAHRLSAIMQATPKAAENAMSGHWPNDQHLAAIVRHFGKDVWDAVFAPEVDAQLAQLQQEERRLADKLAEVRRLRRQAEGSDGDGSGPRPAASSLVGASSVGATRARRIA